MVLARWTALLLTWTSLSLAGHLRCQNSDLVVYTAVFAANWTRELFPKQYPEWRPPAQWTKVVGMSHSSEYRLFQLGVTASPDLKHFAETGKQEILGNGSHNRHVLDEFLMPALKKGFGQASSDFMVDSTHSMVSLVARIVPSPDWFVGIDSLDLCADGHWVDTVTIEASPLDAGTDSGFTYTAPNWATEPQEPIYKITAQYPRHPANSFHYPHLKDLPPIATFHIIKNKTYELTHLETSSRVNQHMTTHLPFLELSSIDYHVTGKNPNSDDNEVILKKHIKRKARKKKRSKAHSKNKICEVGEWSEWTACDAPCGSSIRTRNVTNTGYSCPPLVEKRTCGCTKYVFNW